MIGSIEASTINAIHSNPSLNQEKVDSEDYVDTEAQVSDKQPEIANINGYRSKHIQNHDAIPGLIRWLLPFELLIEFITYCIRVFATPNLDNSWTAPATIQFFANFGGFVWVIYHISKYKLTNMIMAKFNEARVDFILYVIPYFILFIVHLVIVLQDREMLYLIQIGIDVFGYGFMFIAFHMATTESIKAANVVLVIFTFITIFVTIASKEFDHTQTPAQTQLRNLVEGILIFELIHTSFRQEVVEEKEIPDNK